MVGVSVNSVRFLCPSSLGCPVASESDGDFSLISIVWLSSGELSGVSKRFGLSGVVSSISSRLGLLVDMSWDVSYLSKKS